MSLKVFLSIVALRFSKRLWPEIHAVGCVAARGLWISPRRWSERIALATASDPLPDLAIKVR